jgi:ParB family chromosome partitioning protein
MAERKGGLGRGLGAVFAASTATPPAPTEADDAGLPGAQEIVDLTADLTADAPPRVAGAHLREIPPAHIKPNPKQPREHFDEEALAELVHSIREVGVLQPVVVRPLGGDRFELIMGERRWRAAQAAGLELLPAIVRETDDDVLLRDALMENLHRQQLNPLEEAAAYQQLLAEFGATHEELATRIGRSRPHISNTLRLLQLPAAVQRRVAAGILSAGHARALLGLESSAAQEALAMRIVAEGLSVRKVEEVVAVGEPGARPRTTRAVRTQPEAAVHAQTRLADRLDTRVAVEVGKGKGRITIDFADLEDLERIMNTLDQSPPEH